MRRLGVVLGLLLSAFAAKAEANTIDLFGALHFRHSVSAVHLDGNTSLFARQIWNAPASSSVFMKVWWEHAEQGAGAAGWTIWSANSPQVGCTAGVMANVYEYTQSGDTGDTLIVQWCAQDQPFGAWHSMQCQANDVIPRGDAWTMIMFAVDQSVQQCDFFILNGERAESGIMTWDSFNTSYPLRPLPWGSATGWWLGSNAAAAPGPVMDMAESFLDLAHHWSHNAFVDGATAGQFASQQGYALGLDEVSVLPPYTHNCAAPMGNIIPNMCNRGNANAYPIGPEVSPGIDGYTMTVIGTLTTATDDPCLIRSASGDGCAGP